MAHWVVELVGVADCIVEVEPELKWGHLTYALLLAQDLHVLHTLNFIVCYMKCLSMYL